MPLGLAYPVYPDGSMWRLFTTIVYLVIQVARFDAIFDCITNMIGR